MFNTIVSLLGSAGFPVVASGGYELFCRGLKVKVFKPQNIGKLVESGNYDLGITGFDWIRETNANVVELLDLGLFSGRVVVAAPFQFDWGSVAGGRVRVASEFEFLSKQFFKGKRIDFDFIRSFGATESFPPFDADVIVDNVFSGVTLKKNGLKVCETILRTSARLIANRESLRDEEKAGKLFEIVDSFKRVIRSGFGEVN